MKQKPNILVFMTDQQRGDSVSDPRIHLPNIRKLMAGGLTFSNAYCPSPHCCPSRATFLTGQYPTQHGVWNNVCVQNTLSRSLNPQSQCFSTPLVESGYRAFFAGKWHVCYDTGPEDHGFEELFVTCNKESKQDPSSISMSPGWEMYQQLAANTIAKERQPGEILRPGYPDYYHYGTTDNPFNDEDVIHSAIEKLRQLRRSKAPWLMYAGTLGPHDPYFVPQEFIDMYQDVNIELSDIHFDTMEDKPTYNRKIKKLFDQLSLEEKKQAIRHYWAFCTYEDHLLGLLMDELEYHDLSNTLVVVTSDHGDYNGEHGLWCKGLPAFKGAYHIPLVMHWPQGIVDGGREIKELVSLADIAPTITALTDTSLDQAQIGKSLLPFLHNQKSQHHSYLYTQTNGNEIYGIQRAVFNHQWKFVHNTYDIDELYDLTSDPFEINNLAKHPEYSGKIRSMYKKLWRFAEQANDQSLNPYILVGMAQYGPATAFEQE
ncbi:sulfatase-like hydrolase/transferase [Photobacterium satsumensis]|uniref:sulfatase-like hydrolase/transferase n=1 Tax=Photobacterium satsumensis TaxID=2910239 RepID=UPI003D0C05A0